MAAVLVAGRTLGALSGKQAGITDAFVRKLDTRGRVVWTHQFGSSEWEDALRLAVDLSDNVIVAGGTAGALEGENAGRGDAFVRKLDADGNDLWTHQFGTSAHDVAYGVAVDDAGNVLVAGHTSGNLAGENVGESDAFVRMLDSRGRVVWTHQFVTSERDLVHRIAMDGRGHVLIAGQSGGVTGGPPGAVTAALLHRLPLLPPAR